MRHAGETHDASNPMPKIAYTFRRNGTYYFNGRYPKELVGELTENKSHCKYSLETKDWNLAKDRASQAARDFQLELKRLRRQQTLPSKGGDHSAKRSFSSLSEEDQKLVLFEWFIGEEKEADTYRDKLESAPSDQEKRERVLDAVLDFECLSDSEQTSHSYWLDLAKSILEKEGLAFTDDDLQSFAELVRKGRLEIHRRSVERLTGDSPQPPDKRFEELHSFSEIREIGPSGHTIGDICERFPKRFAEGKLKKSTVASYRMPLTAFTEYFGTLTPIADLSFSDGESFIRFLANLPTNASKKFPNLSYVEAAKIAAEDSNIAKLSPKRQHDLFVVVKGALAHAEEIQWIDKNPFGSTALLKILPGIEEKDHVPFLLKELTAIFSSPSFTRWKTAKSPNQLPKQGKFWLPLLSVFLGLRANEAASLLTEDVKEQDGIHYLDVREVNDAGEAMKSLKTKVSKRRVPLHWQILESGFLKYVEERKTDQNNAFLFPELTPDLTTGNRAKAFSQWFNRLARKFVTNEPGKKKKTFHSFRHQVTDAIRAITDSDEKRSALLGWTEGSGPKNAGAKYGSGFPLSQLKEVIDAIEIEGLENSPWQ